MNPLHLSTTVRGQGFEHTLSIDIGNLGGGVIAAPGASWSEAAIDQRPRKILKDGTRLEAGDDHTEHVALLIPATGLIIAVDSIGDKNGESMPHKDCAPACARLDLLGLKWDLARHAEFVPHIDITKRNPAIDTNLFRGIKPAWHWFADPLIEENGAASSAFAWGASLGYGYVNDDSRGTRGFAVAVARAGQ